jgi:queuosine precursor transporter
MNSFKIERMDLLVSVYIFCIVASELMGGKTFPLANIFGYQLNANVAIFLFPLIFTINDIVIEVFGKERARSIVRSGLIVVAILFLYTLLATSLPPSGRFIKTEEAYDTVFQLSARIAAASLIAFTISEFTDIFVFAKIRQRFGKKALWFRNNASNFIAQFFDTVIFMTLAFYALDRSFGSNFIFLTSLILPYWFLKCFMSVVETPLVYLGVRWLKNKQNLRSGVLK